MNVVIMSGSSGSGKGTYIKEIYGPEGDSVKVVSADNFFMKNGLYKFDPGKLGLAHADCLRQFTKTMVDFYNGASTYVGKGKIETLIVDNTNTTTEEIAPYYSVGAAFNADRISLVTLHCSPKIASERNLHGVGHDACMAMSARLAKRQIPRFWRIQEETWNTDNGRLAC